MTPSEALAEIRKVAEGWVKSPQDHVRYYKGGFNEILAICDRVGEAGACDHGDAFYDERCPRCGRIAPPKAEEPAVCRICSKLAVQHVGETQACPGGYGTGFAPTQPDGERHEFMESADTPFRSRTDPCAQCGQPRSAACHR